MDINVHSVDSISNIIERQIWAFFLMLVLTFFYDMYNVHKGNEDYVNYYRKCVKGSFLICCALVVFLKASCILLGHRGDVLLFGICYFAIVGCPMIVMLYIYKMLSLFTYNKQKFMWFSLIAIAILMVHNYFHVYDIINSVIDIQINVY